MGATRVGLPRRVQTPGAPKDSGGVRLSDVGLHIIEEGLKAGNLAALRLRSGHHHGIMLS